MNAICYQKPFDYIVINNFYTKEELQLIWKELEFLTPKLKDPTHTASATENGQSLKNNTGVFLDEVYSDRSMSDILSLNRKLWHPEIISHFDKAESPWWRIMGQCNQDATLLNYYENNNEYKPHQDSAIITAVTILYKEPAQFTGGDFEFSDYNLKIPKQSNMMILFPSSVNHRVTNVYSESLIPFSGRYSLAQFIFLSK
jgi:hypothetical protein